MPDGEVLTLERFNAIKARSTLPGRARGAFSWVIPRKQAGITVTHDNALTYSAVWRAVSLISQSIATLPWHVFRQSNNAKGQAVRNELPTHPAARLLSLQANEETDALTFRETLVAWALTWGNGYAEIVHDLAGRPVELWQITPDRVKPDRTNSGQLIYDVNNQGGPNTVLEPRNMFHLKGLGYDGLRGYSVIAYAARTIGLGLATEHFGANFFANGAHEGGVLQHPGNLSDTALAHIKQSMAEAVSGANQFKPLILEEGMEWTKTTIPPDDAQFLETRKFEVAEVARWYGVPLHKLHEMDKSTFNNIEQQNIEFVTDALMTWVRRLETESNIKLIAPSNRGRVYTKLNLNGLLRGDSKARAMWYNAMWKMGAINQDEIRAFEDMNPIEGGDRYMVQLNITTIDKIGQDPPPALDPSQDDPDEDTDDEQDEGPAREVLVETANRIANRARHRLAEAFNNYTDRADFMRWLARFCDSQREYAQDQLTRTVEIFNLNIDIDQYIDDYLLSMAASAGAAFDNSEPPFHVEPETMVDDLLSLEVVTA